MACMRSALSTRMPGAGSRAPATVPRLPSSRASPLPLRKQVVQAKRATDADEKLIEEMKRAAEKGDVLEGGVAEVGVKILAVAAIVGLIVVIGYLGAPVAENTFGIFPRAS
ncbi:hypothetical protein CHLRE_01g037200v5 [Chlamydomonas reinhardtii]|uniref:Uncharacterized protein n=1 Tax=Chlamydomonas reinhardtii TaxID=3055 RepID=A8HM88_CHLRE|nr:uncharacterized protein CHLRE_01g037200v5 [Chlamydomonas reinhardtii]PNW88615.1 hypothetical protein CHLRE_01g037200v5 [Chlamydomonas reinhardtii]|eukprot:XP_001689650.1 predicted protein [Chlamydomonas reinhardtii]